jgi:carbonic anhydrase/acetyltransferase-like protein (isoleucine patch superfamily)
VVRGDQSAIEIGGRTSIGDRTVVASASVNPTGFSARMCIGDWVTIGNGCVLRGCTVEHHAVVGDGCVLQEGSIVEANSVLDAGSVLPAGARVPTGEVYGGNPAAFVRKLEKHELMEIEHIAEHTHILARKHADEFLSYSTNYQLREQMVGK